MPRGKLPGLRGELAAHLLAPRAFPFSHCWARAESSCVSLGVPRACGCTDLPLRPWVVLALMMTPQKGCPSISDNKDSLLLGSKNELL